MIEKVLDENLLYGDLIQSMAFTLPCPGPEFQPVKRMGYRLTNSSPTDPQNYLPTHIDDKRRGIARRVRNEQEKCKTCSLSLFDSIKAVEAMYSQMSPAIRESRGYAFICAAELSGKDGLSSPIGSSGHYSFFQFRTSSIEKKFTIASEL